MASCMISEGKARIRAELPEVVSREMGVFYNPVMKFNRDTTILLLNSVKKTAMKIGLPLEATGIRGIRILMETKKSKISIVSMNDIKKEALLSMKSNIRLNSLPRKKFIIANTDATKFLLDSNGFDYIDIDPWGSPAPFLDAAVKRLNRHGILAVTATDIGCLAGSFPSACIRKYWAVPKRDENMHETGIRILIRKAQLVASQYDKALIPIFSYFKDHYYRVFFKMEKGRQKADSVLRQHAAWNNAGPLWLGQLWDSRLAAIMKKNNAIPANQQFLNIIASESRIKTVGTLNIHCIAKKHKLDYIPKTEPLLKLIRSKSCKACISHFDNVAVRTDMPEKEFVRMLKSF